MLPVLLVCCVYSCSPFHFSPVRKSCSRIVPKRSIALRFFQTAIYYEYE